MWMLPYALAGLCALFAAVSGLVVLVHAFKESVAQGLLCLFVPFYVVYYVLARFQHPRKALVVTGLLGGPVLAFVFLAMSALFDPGVAEVGRAPSPR